jgi:hypothetical protein
VRPRRADEVSNWRTEARRRRKGLWVGLADLSSILWREREMLELLLFKLEEEQLVLASGRGRWLVHATREVEMVLDHIRVPRCSGPPRSR